MKRLRLIPALIVLIALSGPAAAGALVTLKSATEISGAEIRLSDVFSGVPQDVDRAIAVAPAPGKSVAYDSRILARLAEQYRLDWQPQSAGDKAVLHRASTRITQDMIASGVLDHIQKHNPQIKLYEKPEVLFDNKALDINLPSDKPPVFTLKQLTIDPVDKRFHADLVAETGEAPIVVPLSGKIAVKRNIAVFSRKIDSGVVLNDKDIDWVSMPEDKIMPDMVLDPAQAIGREARREATEGQALKLRDLTAPRLILRGSLVTLKVETPNLLITAQGRALQDGSAGDVIRVTNTQSNRTVEGTVVSAGVVKISTPLSGGHGK